MLLTLITLTAIAHPGADQRPAAQGCAEIAQMFRRSAALSAEARLDEAARELDEAARCDADPSEVAVARAELAVLRGEPERALELLDSIRYDSASARVTRSDALSLLDQPSLAADERLLAIARMPQVPPDLFLRTAHLLEHAGRLPEALATVDEGLKATPATSLQVESIRLAAALDPQRALQRLDRLPETAFWLQRRGEILSSMGRVDEARVALGAALDLARQGRPSPSKRDQVATLSRAMERLEP